MNKDYYTKKEVDDLVGQLKDELIELFSSGNNTSPLKGFKLHTGRISSFEYDRLFEGLTQNGLIRGPKSIFQRVMNEGLEAKKYGIEWIGAQNLCVYMFDLLEDRMEFDFSFIEKKIEKIFGITRAANKKHKYSNNALGLPRGYEKVDNALGPFFKILTDRNIEDQYITDNPDLFGWNDLP